MKKLVVLCIGLLFLLSAGCGGSKTETASADSPEAAAKAYYQALKDGKPDVAYGYRKFDPPKTKEQFVAEKKSNSMQFKDVTVGKAEINGNKATVEVKLKTGNASMPEIPINVSLEKDKSWQIVATGMGGGMGGPAGGAPSGMGGTPPAGMGSGGTPPAGMGSGSAPSGMPPAGSAPSGMPPAGNP